MTRRLAVWERAIPTAQRIAEIRRRMAAMTWGAEARAELSAQWGISEARVTELATEASRSLRSDDADERAALRCQLIARLESLIEAAMGDRSQVTGQIDVRAATEAIEMFARFTGCAPLEPSSPLVSIHTAPIVVSPESAMAFDDPSTFCPHCSGTGRTAGRTAAMLPSGPAIFIPPEQKD